VLVAWGFTEDGERVLLSVMLGMREAHEDWLALGRDLIARGLGAPLLLVADGAPGLIKAIEQCWPASDRQHCAVHRVRNLLAKLPERERERVRQAYWQALDDAINERDAKQRLGALVDELERAGYTTAARCLADDLEALVIHLRYPTSHRRRWRPTTLLERSLGEPGRVSRRPRFEDSVLERGEPARPWQVRGSIPMSWSSEAFGWRLRASDRSHRSRATLACTRRACASGCARPRSTAASARIG
jgi:putative transposase